MCWHKWGKWKESTGTDNNGNYMWQYKRCLKCNKLKVKAL